MIKLPKLFKRYAPNDKPAYLVMLIFSALALTAAFVLTLEKFEKLANPNAVLSCSINIVLNCGTVMESAQSHVFGFPNMIIGLMAYASLVTIAVAGLSGVKFPRWFMIAGNIGILAGLLFSYWLFFQSMYVIEVLCPWCLLVTASTTLIFAAFTHINLANNTLKLKSQAEKVTSKYLAGGYDKLVTFGWLLLLIALVFLKFGDSLFA